jgi:indole-3-glycerol phosphate synthase
MTLEDILDACRGESALRQKERPLAVIRREVAKLGPARGFAAGLRAREFSVIAEVKRSSPSMGAINESALELAHGVYAEHPVVAAISVLTQGSHFSGSPADLAAVRRSTEGGKPKPILRKDFIFSEYEVYYSRWIGADAILLMVNVVPDKEAFRRLHDLALSIGLDVLCEIHEESEIGVIPPTVSVCGINSRRFKGEQLRTDGAAAPGGRDTTTDLSTFGLLPELTRRLPAGCIKVAESGIDADNVGEILRRHPFRAALIGTSLLKAGGSRVGAMLDKIQADALAALHARPQEVSALPGRG